MIKKLPFLLVLLSLYSFSCRSSAGGFFSKKTPHEAYAAKVDDTPEGKAWIEAGEASLDRPVAIDLPYAHKGYFPADKPRALGLQLQAQPGTRIAITVKRPAGSTLPLYADLFRKEGDRASHLLAADTTTYALTYDIDEPGVLVLRLQPELYQAGGYQLSITTAPSLGFPVSGGKAYVGSVWGDDRDGGKRSHEGIDIFAKKGTPAVAAADGYVTAVREGGLGGKTVWFRPEGKTTPCTMLTSIHKWYTKDSR